MQSFGKSQSTRRTEDLRFLRGEGRYVADTAPEGALAAVFVRSPVAHADITVDAEAARDMPGVACVLTSADLGDLDATMAYSTVKNADGSRGASPVRPLLATGRVRHVGELVAMVAARTLAEAKDAAEAIEIDYEERDAKTDLAPGGPVLHDEAPDNVAYDWEIGDAAAAADAFERAAHVVRATIHDNRVIANSLEPRGCWAVWSGGRLHFEVSGQGVWDHKAQLARVMRLPPEAVRVTTQDVGGGFGMKAVNYPENFCVAEAARRTGQPVMWQAERTEGMLSDHAGRDLVTDAEMAFDADHRLIGYRIDTLSNLGATNSEYAQPIQSQLFSKVLTGCYDVQAAHMRARGVYTNTTVVDAYRGAGRPEAIYVIERMMDLAARQLGVDPWALRRASFIGAFPYTTATGEIYDVGDFPRLLARVAEEADRDGFEARRRDSAAAGKLRGMGLCYYIESILGDKTEGARVVFRTDGKVELHVGTQSNGQGHETVYAKFLSDHSGIPFEDIVVVQGDSDVIPSGGGTGGSRSVTMQGNATLGTVRQMLAAYAAFLAEEEGVDPAKVAFDDERFRIEGSNATPTLIEAAERARAAGREDLLDQKSTQTVEARSFPNGAHVCEVEIDPETGQVEVARYTVVDDFGNLINPMLAEGQVHGGVAQGIGQAITEHTVFDPDGQLLTATFMDYGMPRAHDVPFIAFTSEPVPSTANILGMKGCGEAGTVGALAAVTNAVQDAVWELGVRDLQMPFTPIRMWQKLQEARPAEAAE